MLFLNVRFYFGCVVKRCIKEITRQTVYRYEHSVVVYEAESDFIYPRPLDWTGLDCTELFGCTQKY